MTPPDPKPITPELAEQAEQYFALINTTTDGFALLDQQGRILEVNETFCRMTGYTREALLQLGIADLEARETPEQVRTHVQRVIQSGSDHFETRHRTRNGQCLEVSVQTTFVRSRNQFVCFFQDITPRKLAEQTLQRRDAVLSAAQRAARECLTGTRWEDALSSVLGHLGEGLDVSRVYVFANEYSPDHRLLTSQRFEWVAPGVAPQINNPALQHCPYLEAGFRRWITLLQSRQAIHGLLRDLPAEEQTTLQPQGIRTLAVVPIFVGTHWWGFLGLDECRHDRTWSHAEIDALHVVAEVLGAALQAQETASRLRASEARFRTLVENLPGAVYRCEVRPPWRVDYASDGFLEVTGHPPTAFTLRQMTFADMIHPDDLAEVERRVRDAIEARDLYDLEYRILDPAQQVRWVHERGRAALDAEGRPLFLEGVLLAVTQQKQLEAQLLRARRLESIGTLANGVAHDLNNVLAPIMMAVDLLRPLAQQPEDRELLNLLETSAHRGARIISQLLTFSRGVDGERCEIQLRSLLKEIAKTIRDTFPRAIQFEQLFPEELWTLHADATQIHQLLLNLCENARDAMPNGGSLSLTARNVHLTEPEAQRNAGAHPGPYVVIEVADNGTGIEPQHFDRIFDPFFTTKSPGKGSGLGLSAVLGITRSHNGFVQVQTEPGRGSRFQVYLPANPTTPLSPPAPNDGPLPKGSGRLVLVVDDETAVCDVARRMLEANGYQVTTAADGAEALNQVRGASRIIDVALADLMMPHVDGFSFIPALRQLSPATRVVAMSGLQSHEDEALGPGVHADAFLLKPFTADLVLRTLQRVLGHYGSGT